MEIDPGPKAVEKAQSPAKVASTSTASISTSNVSPSHASLSAIQAANGLHESSEQHHDALANGAGKDIEMIDVSSDDVSGSLNAPMKQSSVQNGTASDNKGDTVEEDNVGEDDDDETEEDDEEDDDEDDDEDNEDSASSGSFQSADEVEGGVSRSVATGDGAAGASNGGAVDTAAGSADHASGANATASTGTETFKKPEIPKKKRPRRRSPSFDPPQPIGPPARPTLRLKLTIAHNDEEPYMNNVPDEIHKILKEKEHPWAKWYESTLPEVNTEIGTGDSSNGVNMQELGGLAKLLQKYPDKPSLGVSGGRKRRRFDEYDIGQYDVRDPFVDDSELGMDAPTHVAKPSADGFFVTQGDVELEEASEGGDETMLQNQYPSTLGKKAPIPAGFGESTEDGGGGAGAVSMQMGSKADNIAITNVLLSRFAVRLGLLSPAIEGDDSRESYFDSQAKKQTPINSPTQEKVTQGSGTEGSRHSLIKVDDDNEGRVARSIPKYPTRPVPKRLVKEFDVIGRKVSQESFLKKAKFPPDLKEPLMQASRVAVALGEYNDNYFNWLPHFLPYNRLTLHKYTKRQFIEIHTDTMRNLIDINLQVLEKQVKEALPILQKELDEAKAVWASNGAESAVVDTVGAPAQNGNADTASRVINGETETEEAEKGEEEGASKEGEPIKRWRWSEIQREIIFTIVTIDDAIMDLKTEKITLEGSTEKLSTQNARKLIYKQIYDVWPENGWTTTTAISREYGLYKRKVDRYTQQYHETQGRDIDSAIAL